MEFNGLQVIMSEAMERGTIHAITEPPARDDFGSDVEFEAAYDRWWVKTHCWTVTGTNLESD